MLKKSARNAPHPVRFEETEEERKHKRKLPKVKIHSYISLAGKPDDRGRGKKVRGGREGQEQFTNRFGEVVMVEGEDSGYYNQPISGLKLSLCCSLFLKFVSEG